MPPPMATTPAQQEADVSERLAAENHQLREDLREIRNQNECNHSRILTLEAAVAALISNTSCMDGDIRITQAREEFMHEANRLLAATAEKARKAQDSADPEDISDVVDQCLQAGAEEIDAHSQAFATKVADIRRETLRQIPLSIAAVFGPSSVLVRIAEDKHGPFSGDAVAVAAPGASSNVVQDAGTSERAPSSPVASSSSAGPSTEAMPSYKMSRTIRSVDKLAREWWVPHGESSTCTSQMEARYGNRWRKDTADARFFSVRKPIISQILKIARGKARASGTSEQAVSTTHLLAAAQELEAKRAELKKSLQAFGKWCAEQT